MSPFGKQILPIAQSELERQLAEAEQRGAARVLREIARLPAPIQGIAYSNQFNANMPAGPDSEILGFRCLWCHRSWAGTEEHNDDCLWLRALAAGRDEAR